jgi:hypothetical protein
VRVRLRVVLVLADDHLLGPGQGILSDVECSEGGPGRELRRVDDVLPLPESGSGGRTEVCESEQGAARFPSGPGTVDRSGGGERLVAGRFASSCGKALLRFLEGRPTLEQPGRQPPRSRSDVQPQQRSTQRG